MQIDYLIVQGCVFSLHMLERLPQIFHFRLHLIVRFHIYRLILFFHCIHYFVWDSGGVFFFLYVYCA